MSTKRKKVRKKKARRGARLICPLSHNHVRVRKDKAGCYIVRKNGSKKRVKKTTKEAWAKTVSGQWAMARMRHGQKPWVRETGAIA